MRPWGHPWGHRSHAFSTSLSSPVSIKPDLSSSQASVHLGHWWLLKYSPSTSIHIHSHPFTSIHIHPLFSCKKSLWNVTATCPKTVGEMSSGQSVHAYVYVYNCRETEREGNPLHDFTSIIWVLSIVWVDKHWKESALQALKASCMYSLPLRFPGAKNSPKRSSHEPQRILPAVKCMPCRDAVRLEFWL